MVIEVALLLSCGEAEYCGCPRSAAPHSIQREEEDSGLSQNKFSLPGHPSDRLPPGPYLVDFGEWQPLGANL